MILDCDNKTLEGKLIFVNKDEFTHCVVNLLGQVNMMVESVTKTTVQRGICIWGRSGWVGRTVTAYHHDSYWSRSDQKKHPLLALVSNVNTLLR